MGGLTTTGGTPTGGGGGGVGGQSATDGRDAGLADGPSVTGGTTGQPDAAKDNAEGAAGGSSTSTLPPITDYTAAGPFATVVDKSVGPQNGYTVFRPKTLGENGFRHAPIIFGPGIGMQATAMSGRLTNFASHGFIVVGTPVLNGGPNDPANKAAMIDGLD